MMENLERYDLDTSVLNKCRASASTLCYKAKVRPWNSYSKWLPAVITPNFNPIKRPSISTIKAEFFCYICHLDAKLWLIWSTSPSWLHGAMACSSSNLIKHDFSGQEMNYLSKLYRLVTIAEGTTTSNHISSQNGLLIPTRANAFTETPSQKHEESKTHRHTHTHTHKT